MHPNNLSSLDASTQDISLDYISYTQIENVRDHSDAIVNIYRNLLNTLGISPFDFSNLLNQTFRENDVLEESIIATQYERELFTFFLSSGEKIEIPLIKLHIYLTESILQGDSQDEIERRVSRINAAIESIYNDNYERIFQGEIDDEDVVQNNDFGADLNGKTLKELQELLNIETKKLYQVYDITGETEKKEALLMQEIQKFAGIGDKYEGGARYFSLSDDEIQQKISELIEHMSIQEIFNYIISLNEDIEANWRKSDMVNQINGKVIQALYTQAFERLKIEERPADEFIKFAKVVTGRATIQHDMIVHMGQVGETPTYTDTVEIDDNYKAFDIACQALIHIMYHPDGVLTQIMEQQQVVVEDHEVSDKVPSDIVQNTILKLDNYARIYAPDKTNYSAEVFEKAGLNHLIGTSIAYKDMSFEDKINIGAIYRIGEIIKDASTEELQNPNFVINKVGKTIQASYDELNSSFSDNFDGFYGIFGGETAESLGLTGDFAEIFDLYQDINGNSGFWDWSDANQDRFGNISTIAVLGIGLIAGAIIFAPVLAAGTAATAGAMLIAGAQAGAVTGIASIAFSRQGFDTYYEAVADSFTQVAADTAFGAIFALGGLSLIRQVRINTLRTQYSGFSHAPKVQQYLIDNTPTNLAPDLFLSRSAWRGAGLVDKGFILGEMGTLGLYVSPRVAREVRKSFDSNHYNSDTQQYINGEVINRSEN